MSLEAIAPTRSGWLELLRRVDGAVDELPVGRRHVRLAADVVPRGAVGRDGRDRDDQVAELEVLLQAAAGADAEEALDAELHELLHHDRRRGAAHAGRLHRDRLALPLAGVAEHPALAVALHGVVEVRLGDVLGAQRVAGEEAGLAVVAGLGADVNRHARDPKVAAMPALIEPALDEILAFCAEDPIERVFLEDVARRGLGRFTGLAEDGPAARALPRRHEPRPVGERLRRLRRRRRSAGGHGS